MKVRNYEKKELILVLTLFLLLAELSTFLFLLKRKEYCYQKISGILVDKNESLLVVDSKERNILQKNKTIMLEDKKVIYTIEQEHKIEDQEKYYEVLIKVKTPKGKKKNEILEFSVKDQKKSILKMFFQIWRWLHGKTEWRKRREYKRGSYD